MKGPNYFSHSSNRFKCKATKDLLNETMVMVCECQLILYPSTPPHPTQPPTNDKSSLIIILLLYLHSNF